MGVCRNELWIGKRKKCTTRKTFRLKTCSTVAFQMLLRVHAVKPCSGSDARLHLAQEKCNSASFSALRVMQWCGEVCDAHWFPSEDAVSAAPSRDGIPSLTRCDPSLLSHLCQKDVSLFFEDADHICNGFGGNATRFALCWLLGTSVRKISGFLRTDVPSSQHRHRKRRWHEASDIYRQPDWSDLIS